MARWEYAIACHGGSGMLQDIVRARVDQGDRRTTEVAAWPAACEATKTGPSATELIRGLLGARFGTSRPRNARAFMDSIDATLGELPLDMRLSRLLLDDNAKPPADRKAAAFSPARRILLGLVWRPIRLLGAPKAKCRDAARFAASRLGVAAVAYHVRKWRE